MDLTSIVYILILIVVLYYFISWFSATSVSLSKISPAHVSQVIDNTKTDTKKLILHTLFGLMYLVGLEMVILVERK